MCLQRAGGHHRRAGSPAGMALSRPVAINLSPRHRYLTKTSGMQASCMTPTRCQDMTSASRGCIRPGRMRRKRGRSGRASRPSSCLVGCMTASHGLYSTYRAGYEQPNPKSSSPNSARLTVKKRPCHPYSARGDWVANPYQLTRCRPWTSATSPTPYSRDVTHGSRSVDFEFVAS